MLYRYNGILLRHSNLLARSADCCCLGTVTACGCEWSLPLPNLRLTIHSDCAEIDGDTVDLTPQVPELPPDAANCWIGTYANSPDCFGAEMRICCNGGATCSSLELTIFPQAAGGCEFVNRGGDEVPTSCSCGPPLSLTYEYGTDEVIPGGCSCCTVPGTVTFTVEVL